MTERSLGEIPALSLSAEQRERMEAAMLAFEDARDALSALARDIESDVCDAVLHAPRAWKRSPDGKAADLWSAHLGDFAIRVEGFYHPGIYMIQGAAEAVAYRDRMKAVNAAHKARRTALKLAKKGEK